MTEMIPPSDNNPTPFAGRQAMYARLQQQILDPPHRHALVFTGHEGMGKTALLQQFCVIFDDPILAIFTSLSETTFADKDALLQTLIDGINRLLNEHNFSLSRVPNIADDPDKPLAEWFRDVYLPEIVRIIRPHRRIVWLLDDAENLLKFEASFTQYLHGVMATEQQFTIILTLSTEHDDKLAKLYPLVNPVMVERIHRLTDDESSDVIRQYAPGANDTIVGHIFKATGGHPRLLARFGQILHQHWADYPDSEAFEHAKPDVYRASHEDFRQIWLKLSRDERLVLTAIASLIYDDPLQVVTPSRIEAWLIETDYMLDIIAINAALRGLDYQDIVSHQQQDGIKLTMGLMQQWLLEQARLDDSVPAPRGTLPIRLIVLALVIILIIVVLLIWLPPQYLDSNPAISTATLAS